LNGQRIDESTGFTKYDEARDLLKKREGAIADGVPITAKSTRLTFDDAAKNVDDDYTRGSSIEAASASSAWTMRGDVRASGPGIPVA